jgi:hypothetical protein
VETKGISGEENHDPNFLHGNKSTSPDNFASRQSFTQDHLVSQIVPVLTTKKVRFQRHHPGVTFSVYMDNSLRHSAIVAMIEVERQNLRPPLFTRPELL